MFQLDDSKSLYGKWLFHQTSINKWFFGVPGRTYHIGLIIEQYMMYINIYPGIPTTIKTMGGFIKPPLHT